MMKLTIVALLVFLAGVHSLEDGLAGDNNNWKPEHVRAKRGAGLVRFISILLSPLTFGASVGIGEAIISSSVDSGGSSGGGMGSVIETMYQEQEAHTEWVHNELMRVSEQISDITDLSKENAKSISRQLDTAEMTEEQKGLTKGIIRLNAAQLQQHAQYFRSIAENSDMLLIRSLDPDFEPEPAASRILRRMRFRNEIFHNYHFFEQGSISAVTEAIADDQPFQSRPQRHIHPFGMFFHNFRPRNRWGGIKKYIHRNSLRLSTQMQLQTAKIQRSFAQTSNIINERTTDILTAVDGVHWDVKKLRSDTETINANILILHDDAMKGIWNLNEVVSANFRETQNLTAMFWQDTSENLDRAMQLIRSHHAETRWHFQHISAELAKANKNIEMLLVLNKQVHLIRSMEKIAELYEMVTDFWDLSRELDPDSSELVYEKMRIKEKCKESDYDPRSFLRFIKRKLVFCHKCAESQVLPHLFDEWQTQVGQTSAKAILVASFCMKEQDLSPDFIKSRLIEDVEGIFDVIGKANSLEQLHYGQWWYKNIRHMYTNLRNQQSEASIRSYLDTHKNQLEFDLFTKNVLSTFLSSASWTIPGFRKVIDSTHRDYPTARPTIEMYCCDLQTHLCHKQMNHSVLSYCPWTTVWIQKISPGNFVILNWMLKSKEERNQTSPNPFVDNVAMIDGRSSRGFFFEDFSNYVEAFNSTYPWLKYDFAPDNGGLTGRSESDTSVQVQWNLTIIEDNCCWWNNLRYFAPGLLSTASCESGGCNWTWNMESNGNLMAVYFGTDKKTCCQLCHMLEGCYSAQWIIPGACLLKSGSTHLVPTVSGSSFATIIYHDSCVSAPCINGGNCSDVVNGNYTCKCPVGFTGDNCEIDIDDCMSDPCQNNATCTDDVNGYICSCPSGFSGPNCETNINDCSSNPCQNYGNCTDLVNGYHCTCSRGYLGDNCEMMECGSFIVDTSVNDDRANVYTSTNAKNQNPDSLIDLKVQSAGSLDKITVYIETTSLTCLPNNMADTIVGIAEASDLRTSLQYDDDSGTGSMSKFNRQLVPGVYVVVVSGYSTPGITGVDIRCVPHTACQCKPRDRGISKVK